MSTAVQTKYRPEDLLAMEHGPRYELIDGELVEKPMGAESSKIAGMAFKRIANHADQHGGGHAFPSNCGYQAFPHDPGQVRYPDASFIRPGRLPNEKSPKGHVRIHPDLAVEVVSPNDTAEQIDERVADFLEAGTPLVWMLYPNTLRVMVYRQGGKSSRRSDEDILDGEEVLPGFSVRVADLFAQV